MPRLSAVLPVLLALVMPLSAPAQPRLTLDEVRTAYRDMGGLEAAFTQVVGSGFGNDSTRVTGRVVLSGNKYRVEMPGQTVVTNGTTTWIYSPADSQVVVNDAASADGPITPESFLAASAQNYEVRERRTADRDGTPHVVLRLAAATDTARFETAALWVRASDRVVTRLRATDRDGATFDLRLRDITVSAALPDSTFVFDPPSDVEVIDLRAGR